MRRARQWRAVHDTGKDAVWELATGHKWHLLSFAASGDGFQDCRVTCRLLASP